MKSFARPIAVAAAATLILAGCSSTPEPTAAPGELALVTPGSFTICTNPPYEPFEFSKDGKIIGFDIDLATEIAKDLGVELEIVATPFEGIESGTALNTNQCDAGITGMSINDARASVMDFSDPYYEDGLGLLVKKDSGVETVDDLGDEPVGVQQATTGETYSQDKGLNVVQYEDSGLANQAVQNGSVAGVINNLAVIRQAADGETGLEVVQEFESESYGVAIRQGNTALVDAVNKTISRIKDDGTFDTMVSTWIK